MSTWKRQSPPLGEIKFETLNVTAYSLIYSASRKEYNVDAPYQRNSVWTVEQRRDLICSLVRGLPIGGIIRSTRNVRSEGPMYRVVDGKQRLEAIWAFADGELDVPADWFADRALNLDTIPADGMIRYEHLSDYGQRHFENQPIAMLSFDSETEWVEVPEGTGTHGAGHRYTIRHRTDDEMLAYEAEIFGLINGGGTAQTDESMARAAEIAKRPH